jgi:hypothetical protein
MFMWWPRIIPYIGPAWVFCDRYGKIGATELLEWECKVIIVSWFYYAVTLYQFDPPRRIDDESK